MDQKYVAGFMFDYPLKRVALIKKNRPEWQAGKLNAIGGHIEQGETPIQAMVREFEEETGLKTNEDLWFEFAKISENGAFDVTFFVTQGFLDPLRTITDEEICIVPVSDVNADKMIENLSWLVPLAIDHITDGRPGFCEVTYPER